MSTVRIYSYDELRAIIPQRQKKTSIRWADFDRSFCLPISEAVPLYECLSRDDRDLIDHGIAEGSRNDRGFALAANLIATSDYLTSIGQPYDGDPRELFDQYCQRCTPLLGGDTPNEDDAIWNSALKRADGPSLSSEAIKNCVKSWHWKSLKGGQRFPNGKHLRAGEGLPNNVVNFPQTEKLQGQTVEQRVRDLLNGNLSCSQLAVEKAKLRQELGLSGQELDRIFDAVNAEDQGKLDKAEAEQLLPSLLEYQSRRLDPRRYLEGELPHLMMETAEAMPTTPAFIFTTFLAVAASRIGTAARVIVKASARYTQLCIMNTAIVAPSGAKKTPAQRIVIDPLMEMEAEAGKQHAQEMEEFTQVQADYEAAVNKYKGLKKDDKAANFPTKPKPPVRRRFVTKDATIESLQAIHADNPRGLLVYRDELIGGRKSRNAYRGGLGADGEIELELFNGSPITVDRKSGSIFLPKSAISRTGSIQLEVLRKSLGDHSDDNGENARWLYCAEPAPPGYINLTGRDADVDTGISTACRKLYEDLDQVPDRDYFLSFEAKQRFQNWQHQLVDWAREETQPGLALAYPKFESYTVRLALLLHITNSVLRGNLDPAHPISGETMAQAIDLTGYYVGQLRVIFAHNAPSAGLAGILLKIKDFAERKGQPISASDAIRGIRELRKTPPTEVRRHFKTLAGLGYAQLDGEAEKLCLRIDTVDNQLTQCQPPETLSSMDYNHSIDKLTKKTSLSLKTQELNSTPPLLDFSKSICQFVNSTPESQPLQGIDPVDKVVNSAIDMSIGLERSRPFQKGDRVVIHLPGSKSDGKIGVIRRLRDTRGLALADIQIDGEQQTWEAQQSWLTLAP